jgi:hypothetical protein
MAGKAFLMNPNAIIPTITPTAVIAMFFNIVFF